MAVIQNQQLCRMAAAIHPQLSHLGEALRRVPMAAYRGFATAIVLVYCCYVSARMFWFVVPLPELEQPGVEQLPRMISAVAAIGSPTVDIRALQDTHLFGVEGDGPAQQAVVQLAVIDAEETKLDLLLLGVVVSDHQSAARAVIAHRNKQQLFALGDKLPGGAQVALHQVLPGRVIINNAGHYEALWLYEDDDATDYVLPANTAMAHVDAVKKPVEPPREKPAARVVLPLPETLITDPATLADIIKFTPVHADGRILGYRVSPGRAPKFFDQFGLKRNDMITSVNGVTLDDPTRALKVYRLLQGAKSASFELVRDGQTRVLEIELASGRGRG